MFVEQNHSLCAHIALVGLKACLQLCRVQCSRWRICRRWTTQAISVFLPTLCQGGCLLFADWKRRDRGFRWQLAPAHFYSTEGSLSFSPPPLQARLSPLFARIWESGFSKGTKESGARAIEAPSSPSPGSHKLQAFITTSGRVQPTRGNKTLRLSWFHQYRFIFSLAW